MANRLQRSLEQVLGPGRSTVMVKAAVDMNSESIVSKVYEKGIPVEETIDETSTVKQTVTEGEEGSQALPGSTEKSGTTTTQYMLPETITTRTKVPGQVTAWSVSVMVDLAKTAPAETEGEEGTSGQTAEGQGELLMTLEDVKEIIRTAIGPELLQEENLTVKHVPFYRPAPMPVEAGIDLNGIVEIARQLSMGILAISALLVLRIFTRAGKKAAKDSMPHPETMAGGVNLPLLSGGSDSPTAMRKLISGQLQQNPEQVRILFSSWLAEDQ